MRSQSIKKDCSMVTEKVKEEMVYRRPEPSSCLDRDETVYDWTE